MKFDCSAWRSMSSSTIGTNLVGKKGIPVRLTVFIALLLCLGISARLKAQAVGATLSGTVTDSSGSAVPKADISIKNIATGFLSAFYPLASLMWRTALAQIAQVRCIDMLMGSSSVYMRLRAPEPFLAGIVLGTKELGWLGILIDLCVLLVLFVMLFVVTAPFWSLGVIYWRWRRESRQVTGPQRQARRCNRPAGMTKSDGRATRTTAS